MEEYQVTKLINTINNKALIHLNNICKDKDLSILEYRFVLSLVNNGGISQDKLSNLVDVNKSVTTRTLSSLLDKECIYREDDRNDGRIKKISLTNLGYEYAKEFEAILFEFESQLLSSFSDLEQENILYNFRKLNSILNKMNLKSKR
ncbi:MAG: MarR family transcriptional regulator [Erysipelotrichales bacterium]